MQLLLGNAALLEQHQVATAELEAPMRDQAERGVTPVLLAVDGKPAALFAIRDPLREDSVAALQRLHQQGYQLVMLTGDNPVTANAIAKEAGIDRVIAGVLPDGKAAAIKQLQAQGQRVAMVGDGINDAPAMKASSIGIAMGSGTDVALETADAALTHNRLLGVAEMIRISRATHANIRQNITIALGLKGVFLITSLLGLTGLWLAVLADSGATALVTANALRLLRKRQ